MTFSPAFNVIAIDTPSDINIGPYVDKVVFKVIEDDDLRALALQTGTIDMDASYLRPSQLQILAGNPDISILSTPRNGYGHITINCRDYPLNISAFRRAFAYAFDKTRVTIEVMEGNSHEHDSLVPLVSNWCIEEIMPYHYYIAEVAKGVQILNEANFTIDSITGFRSAPDGSSFNVIIEYPSVLQEAGMIAQIGVDALLALDVNAEIRGSAFSEYISRLDNHGDYDMIYYAYNFHDDDVDWLAYQYWSEYANTTYQNPTNFKNSTYDSWRNQLLYNTSYDAVYEAASEMQMILQYNVPRLVVNPADILQAYRTDKFTGCVEDHGRYIAGTYTLRKIHKIDGTPGGSVSIALGEPESFNVFLGSSVYASAILTNLWPRLYLIGPDLTPQPYLAEHLLKETHSENPAIQEGHTRFTIDIVQNATWSDGTPLTAEDVAMTFNYCFESAIYGNPVATGLRDLVAAYAPTSFRAIIQFSTESYWHFSTIAFNYIIPKHVFNEVNGIGFSEWNKWNPVFNPVEPYVTAGPFKLTDFEVGEFSEISANPSFWFFPKERPNTTETSSPTIPSSTFDFVLAFAAGGVSAAFTILVGRFTLLNQSDRHSDA